MHMRHNPGGASELDISPPGRFRTRTPAQDYSHCTQYWPDLDQLQFRRTDVPAPTPGGLVVPAYYGFREVT
jgi:hypothetical protein